METKLKQAGDTMPLPETTFRDVAAKAERKPVTPRRVPRAALIIMILVLGLALSAGAYRYTQVQRGMWRVIAYHDFASAQKLYLDHYNLVLPEELDGHSFSDIVEYSVVDQGVDHLQAMLSKFYRPISLAYDDDWTNRSNGPGVTIGTTQEEYWTTYFSINEDGVWENKYDVPDSWETTIYQGYEIQLVLRQYAENTHACALWTDPDRNICITMNVLSDNTADALELAKQIIDLNIG